MISIFFGEIASAVGVVMTDFLGAKESLVDLEDLLLLDLEDLRIEELVEMTDDDGEEDGFAHCIIVFRRNLFFSF